MADADLLSTDDLRSMLAAIEESRTDDPGPILPWAMFDGLAALIPAEEVSLCKLDLAHQRREIQQGVLDLTEQFTDLGSDDPPNADELFWRYREYFWAKAPPESSGKVRRWTDFYGPRELREQPLFAEFFALDGINYAMYLPLPAPPGTQRNVLFWRHSGHDFTDREKLILQLLRPHMHEIYRDAERRRMGIPRLSAREWEVLQLVSQGMSNSEIARHLFTSVSTVRKHMEHIFERTGVRTRTAAVDRMMPRI